MGGHICPSVDSPVNPSQDLRRCAVRSCDGAQFLDALKRNYKPRFLTQIFSSNFLECFVLMKMPSVIRDAQDWFFNTSERALDQAYQAALKIKEIENKNFNGQRISRQSADLSKTVVTYLQSELNKNLQIIRTRMIEFKASNLFLSLSGIKVNNLNESLSDSEKQQRILEKLNFIDAVIERYEKQKSNGIVSNTFVEIIDQNEAQKQEKRVNYKIVGNNKKQPQKYLNGKITKDNGLDTISEKTGLLPRSFLSTFKRIQQEMDPNSQETEEDVVNKFRKSRYKTAVSIKLILLLIIVPLLTHSLAKIVIDRTFVHRYFTDNSQIVFINKDFEEEAFQELKAFEERIHFETLIGVREKKSEEEIEEELKTKADELAIEFKGKGAEAIDNIIADTLSLFAFGIVVWTSKKEIAIVKSFIDDLAYGLSDSAKAFLIILFTDIFVGYHSPHGWEVLLEGITRHFGLPENRDFNFLFIATFPVILDTVLKYWIFRYLNRISPSAVATYKNMNE